MNIKIVGNPDLLNNFNSGPAEPRYALPLQTV